MPAAPRGGDQVEALATALLQELGWPVPLDVDRLLRAQRLELVRRPLRAGIPGLIHLASGTIVVDSALPEPDRRLVICHEVAHAILPEHQLALLQTPEPDLGWRQRLLLRGQANRFAAALLFGGAPDAMIADAEPSLNAVRSLAALANAPLEAAFRRFVTRNPHRLWGLVCGARGPEAGGPRAATVAVRYALASDRSIWCGTPQAVRLPGAPTGRVAGIRPAASEQRLIRSGARWLQWTQHPRGVLVLMT